MTDLHIQVVQLSASLSACGLYKSSTSHPKESVYMMDEPYPHCSGIHWMPWICGFCHSESSA